MMPNATRLAFSAWMSPAFFLMSSRKGMEPTMSITANITMVDLRSSVQFNCMSENQPTAGSDKDSDSRMARKVCGA